VAFNLLDETKRDWGAGALRDMTMDCEEIGFSGIADYDRISLQRRDLVCSM